MATATISAKGWLVIPVASHLEDESGGERVTRILEQAEKKQGDSEFMSVAGDVRIEWLSSK
jgi:hypothetical protein